MTIKDNKADAVNQDQATLKKKKRRLERTAIVISILIIIVLTVIQTRVVQLGVGIPTSHSILVFAIININIVLLFFLLVLVLRNLYKIFFEERKVTGGQLRTKLVVAFVSLSLVPTGLLFYSALQFISAGHDYWFDEKVEQSLVDSVILAKYTMDVNERNTINFGENIRDEVIENKLYLPEAQGDLDRFLRKKRREYHFSLIEVVSTELKPVITVRKSDFIKDLASPLPLEIFTRATSNAKPVSKVDSAGGADLVRVIWPLIASREGLTGFLVVGSQSIAPLREKMHTVSRGLEGYRELQRIKEPIRVSLLIALTIVALLSIFVSTWIGFHLAKGITGPIMDLAEGTERIASGDYDFTIEVQSSAGEIGTLVASFNRMKDELRTFKNQLTQKNIELQESNTELEQRRRYTETILQNVAAGVISADAGGVITTINNSAEEILHLKAEKVLGKHYKDIMAPEQWAILDELMRSAQKSGRGTSDKQIKVKIDDQLVSLNINITLLKDDSGQELGLVIVFDDLSELEKAQRMSAWREVARRIAHEIKNPLTPIQLSTQRLRKRYGDRLVDDGQLFDECTQMIIRQVDELKRLVNEFSSFARMPESNPAPNDLSEIVEETIILYSEGHKGIEFTSQKDPELPILNLDREQIKRVMINLLDNAVAALGNGGRIEINLTFDKLLKMVRLEVADNGLGISPQDKAKLFEPYFSTKKSGTGLGLTIVRTIVADHDGFVRVQDNAPRGTKFIIELPVKE